jgi:serine/threonine-protein kinase
MDNWKQFSIVVFMCVLLAGFSGCRTNQLVEVPDLRGIELHQAEEILEELGLVLQVKDSIYSSSVPQDTILTQVPFPSTEVKYGRSVSVKISKGSPVILCPDFVGKSYGEAMEIVQNANLFVREIQEVESFHPSDQGDEQNEQNEEPESAEDAQRVSELLSNLAPTVSLGHILSQTPSPGTKMKPGQGITLTVYLPSLPRVPNLLDSYLEDAKYIITHSGYTIGTITFKPNTAFSRGVVYIQEPIPGSPAEKNSSINIVVNEELIRKSVGSD